MHDFISKRGCRSHFMLHHKIFQIKTGLQTDLSLRSALRKKAKNDHVLNGTTPEIQHRRWEPRTHDVLLVECRFYSDFQQNTFLIIIGLMKYILE